MHTGLVIDDPAHALGIDKCAVDHHVGTPAGSDPRQPPFRAAFGMRIQHPAAARITDTIHQRLPHAYRCSRDVLLTNTFRCKRMADRRFQRGDARRVPTRHAVFSDTLQPAMHHAADMARSLPDPGKLEIILRARGILRCRPISTTRRSGQRPCSRQPAQGLVDGRRRPCSHRQLRRRRIAQCRFIHGSHHRPQFSEQRLCRRRLDPRRTIFFSRNIHAAQQMQLPFGTGRRHIQQPPVLQALFLAVELFNPGIDRIAVIASRVDRRQQQFVRTIRIWLLGPQEQFFIIVTWRFGETGHDHHIKLQSLGLVDGHDLQAVIGIEIRQGI